ncbi:MAG: phenylacetic acid degradation operon negative regulatory protein [Gammaproteobacteria bacterium]
MLAQVLDTHPPRAGSLIVTVFGDAISQHGNAVWLGSLIKALEPLGLNARQIRTAAFRLVKDGWLSCVKVGRRSHYSFTEFGFRQYAKSARRIYATEPIDWDGHWTLVMPVFASADLREQLKRELSWLGFGTMINGVLAHPCADKESLAETLAELNVADQTVVWRATSQEIGFDHVLKRLTHESWYLGELGVRFDGFIGHFQPSLAALESVSELDIGQMFELQTLLVHEYRRIILKTTDLPDELLPTNWSGRAAVDLTARLYDRIRAASANYLGTIFEGPHGRLEKAGAGYYERFRSAADPERGI